MAAVREMPDLAWNEMTIGAGHDAFVKAGFECEIVLPSDDIGENKGTYSINSGTCIGPTRNPDGIPTLYWSDPESLPLPCTLHDPHPRSPATRRHLKPHPLPAVDGCRNPRICEQLRMNSERWRLPLRGHSCRHAKGKKRLALMLIDTLDVINGLHYYQSS